MNIEDLVKRQEQLVADVEAIVAGRKTDTGGLQRPIELQEAQFRRVEARIDALEQARTAYVQRVDAELKALKAELGERRKRIDAERQSFDAAGAAAATGGKKPKAAPKTATRAAPARSPKAPRRGKGA